MHLHIAHVRSLRGEPPPTTSVLQSLDAAGGDGADGDGGDGRTTFRSERIASGGSDSGSEGESNATPLLAAPPMLSAAPAAPPMMLSELSATRARGWHSCSVAGAPLTQAQLAHHSLTSPFRDRKVM